jgi:phosphoribosylamine-glycine ligase
MVSPQARASPSVEDLDEAISAIDARIGVAPIVIEERLEGREASLIAICDGKEALALPLRARPQAAG